MQRFDSGLRLNVHFHVVWLDGVHSWQPGRGEVAWHEHEGLTDAHVAALVRRIGASVRKALKKAGKWWDDGDGVRVAPGGSCEPSRRVKGPIPGDSLLTLEL